MSLQAWGAELPSAIWCTCRGKLCGCITTQWLSIKPYLTKSPALWISGLRVSLRVTWSMVIQLFLEKAVALPNAAGGLYGKWKAALGAQQCWEIDVRQQRWQFEPPSVFSLFWEPPVREGFICKPTLQSALCTPMVKEQIICMLCLGLIVNHALCEATSAHFWS